MSDDEDNTCLFGTALPKLPDDVVPTKKPITVADQIAVDVNGRRRFHGAFTGGFSAGYWNTVGSKEGWEPQTFKSSRAEKASRVQQAPNDFMDDEDMGEFGIAPQRIQTTDDFRSDKKNSRKRGASQLDSGGDLEGPILGTPVLNLFLKPAKDKASVSLLKKMGWRENQGVGKRLTKTEKQIATKMAAKEKNIYRCDLGPLAKMVTNDEEGEDDKENDDDSSSDSDTEITFAPDDYEPLIQAFKTNRFGLGYSGLDKGHSVLYTGGSGHVELFSADPLVLLGKKGHQKLSIRGQAFGVGAFEEDDDDIYAKEDLSAYDFSLADKKPKEQLKIQDKKHSNIIEGFAPATTEQSKNKEIFLVDIPRSFQPRNWAQRKTRFGPAPPSTSTDQLEENSTTTQGTRRHMLTPEERGQILNDELEKKTPNILPLQQPIIIIDKTIPEPKPIDEFIKLNEPKNIVNEIPTNLSQKPKLKNSTLESLLNDTRFVSENDLNKIEVNNKTEEPISLPLQPLIKEVKIQMKREKKIWSPCPLLCQRMNIAEPMSSKANIFHQKPNGSFSLFECLSGGGKSVKKGSRRNRRNDTGEREFTPAEDSDVNSSLMHMTSGSSQKLVENIHINDKIQNITPTSPPPPVPKLPVPEKLNKPDNKLVPILSKVKPVPKTELELQILDAEKKHPSEKKDIYKAIFDSSDEDEDNNVHGGVDPDNNDKNKEIIQSVPMPEHITTTILPKLSKDFNILRNTSPPRGIFANFISSTQNLPTNKSLKEKSPTQLDNKTEKDVIDEKLNEIEIQTMENSYGPVLPTRLLDKPNPTKNKHSFVKPSSSKGDNDQIQNIFTTMRSSSASSSVSSFTMVKKTEKLTFQKPLPTITRQDRRSLSFSTNEDKEFASSSDTSSDDQDEWVDATVTPSLLHKKSKKPKEKRKKSKKDKKHKSKSSKKHKKKSSKDKR